MTKQQSIDLSELAEAIKNSSKPDENAISIGDIFIQSSKRNIPSLIKDVKTILNDKKLNTYLKDKQLTNKKQRLGIG